jgi:hypothetical protein
VTPLSLLNGSPIEMVDPSVDRDTETSVLYILVDLSPAHTIVLQTVNPCVTQIVVGAVFSADCNCLALLRDGNRITKLVTLRIPDDVLADLIPVS